MSMETIDGRLRYKLSRCLKCGNEIKGESVALCGFPPRWGIIDSGRVISGEFHDGCARDLTVRQVLAMSATGLVER